MIIHDVVLGLVTVSAVACSIGIGMLVSSPIGPTVPYVRSVVCIDSGVVELLVLGVVIIGVLGYIEFSILRGTV